MRPYDEKYETRIENLGLKLQTLTALQRAHFTKTGEILEMAGHEIFKIRGFTEAEYEDLLRCLQAHGCL